MNCTAVVLCGGKSTRMGFDKSLLQVDGEFVLLRTVGQLQSIFSEVLLVTDKQQKFPKLFAQIPMIEDAYPEKGPLGGLVTALESIGTDFLFLVACDIPEIPVVLIQEMAQFMESNDVVICKQSNRFEPLFAFYHTSCVSILQQQLQTNDWRIRKEFGRFSVKVVDLDTSIDLKNVNTPKELAWWSQRVK